MSAALPLAWVERIFERLIAYHGARFLNQFVGIDTEKVKVAWALELGKFEQATVRRALDHLKTEEEVPTLQRFISQCRQVAPLTAPTPAPALPPPPEQAVRRARAAAIHEYSAFGCVPSSDWAIDVLDHISAGEIVREIVERSALEALANTGRLEEVPAGYITLNRLTYRNFINRRT